MSARRSAPATTLHFTQADNAIANIDKIVIQIREPRMRLPAIQRLLHAHPAPAKLAWITKRITPGIQVICESRIASTEDLPSTYSAREKGRQKYSGSAPLDKSGEMRPGPANAVIRNARTP